MSNESIRFRLESSLPSIEYYITAKLLSKNEASRIIEERTEFAYRLSQKPLLRDFKGAIELEERLDKKVRRKSRKLGTRIRKSGDSTSGNVLITCI